MRAGFPKVYRSFQEFEREELGRQGLRTSVEDMIDEMFGEELDFEEETPRRGRRRAETDF